ncbi:putative Esterase/lipase [Podospora fimiseda]|uniref:Esterase/lipase n=1 Tax=Podospora fimiseda TaxID=252190 RepID=A0AAN7GUG2_9PEZI|nr:putative Esterase/lipase [Podospora fimiseda]
MSNLDSTLAGHAVPKAGASQPTNDGLDLIEDHIIPKLDSDFLDYFTNVVAKKPPAHEIPIEIVRANPQDHRPPCALDTSSGYDRVADYVVSSQDGASIDVRAYHPDPAKFGPGPYPVHLNFHGGGFVLGDLHSEASLCLSMREAGVVVVDVNYRHCPETIWGKCIQDAWAALNWVRDSHTTININPTSVSIGGISAGAHISIVLQHMARDAGITLKLCMASVPPSTDALSYQYYTQSPFPSFHEFHRGPVLPWKRMKYFGKHCFPQDKLAEIKKLWPDWWLAPIRASNWKGLCDTYIRTAECDPLRDEGEAYANKLIAGGTKVTVKRYIGCPHTFMYLAVLKQKHEYDRDAIEALRIAHGVQPVTI